MRSEYYDITGSLLVPKEADAALEVYEPGQEIKRAYAQIGVVKVVALYGTTREAMNAEIIKRARAAGADAVVDVQYLEDKENKLSLCGKLFSTKRNTTATGKAIVFTPPAGSMEKK
jgi:uncharacterized protein YbjQ (UPF0145 family)